MKETTTTFDRYDSAAVPVTFILELVDVIDAADRVPLPVPGVKTTLWYRDERLNFVGWEAHRLGLAARRSVTQIHWTESGIEALEAVRAMTLDTTVGVSL